MGVFASLILVAWGQVPFFDLAKDFVVTDDGAYGMRPPDVVSGQTTLRGTWSFDGKQLVLVQAEFEPTKNPNQIPKVRSKTISVRDMESGRASTIVSLNRGESVDIKLAPNAPLAFLFIDTPYPSGPSRSEPAKQAKILRVDLRTGKLTVWYESGFRNPAINSQCQFSVNPKDHRILIELDESIYPPDPQIPAKDKYLLTNANLTGFTEPKLPAGAMSLSIDKNGGYVTILGRKLFAVDPDSGLLGKELDRKTLAFPEEPEANPRVGLMTIMPSAALYRLGTKSQSIEGAWLAGIKASEQQFALIAPDALQPVLSPAGDAIFYISKGNGMIRRLQKLTLAEWKIAQETEQRTSIMSRAKQLGTSLAIFAADNDDTYPNGDNIKDRLMPYCKNEGLFKDFHYTFAGGPTSGIANPASTEIGYVDGPGGRAIIYADTSVRWKANP